MNTVWVNPFKFQFLNGAIGVVGTPLDFILATSISIP